MSLITLQPGDVARANDVNANFAFVMSLIGELSSPDRIKTTTEFLMGARQNVLFTGTFDTGDVDDQFFQIGYNADYNFSPTSGTWKFQRFISGTSASALRLGAGEISFWTTSAEQANLNASMQPVFKIKVTQDDPNTDYIYVPRSIHFQSEDSADVDDLDSYRLQYVPFLSPNAIYDGQTLSKAATVKTASDFGVTAHAKAISISCNVLADAGEDAQIKFYQNRLTPSDRFGFIVTALAGKRASGWGIVPLGVGSYRGEFYIGRTAIFSSANAYIVGYWL